MEERGGGGLDILVFKHLLVCMCNDVGCGNGNDDNKVDDNSNDIEDNI